MLMSVTQQHQGLISDLFPKDVDLSSCWNPEGEYEEEELEDAMPELIQEQLAEISASWDAFENSPVEPLYVDLKGRPIVDGEFEEDSTAFTAAFDQQLILSNPDEDRKEVDDDGNSAIGCPFDQADEDYSDEWDVREYVPGDPESEPSMWDAIPWDALPT